MSKAILKSKTKTTLQLLVGTLSLSTCMLGVYESALTKAIDVLQSFGWKGKDLILGNLNGLSGVLNPILNQAKNLSRLVGGGMRNVDTSDEKISMLHIEIIKSKDILERYKTAKDLEGLDEVTRELHMLSWIYNNCAAESIYHHRFPGVNQSQSNKKQRV